MDIITNVIPFYAKARQHGEPKLNLTAIEAGMSEVFKFLPLMLGMLVS